MQGKVWMVAPKCPDCGAEVSDEDSYSLYFYCPNCGPAVPKFDHFTDDFDTAMGAGL